MMTPPNLQKFGSDNFKGDIQFNELIISFYVHFLFWKWTIFYLGGKK